MAQSKKDTKTSSTASKKTADRAKASAKNTKSEKKERLRDENSFLSQAAPYIMAVIAVFLAVCVIIGEGTVGGGIKKILTGLFAGSAYALPIIILVRTFLWKRDSEEGQLYGRNFCSAVVMLLLAMLLHIVGGGKNELGFKIHYVDGNEFVGGGVIGGILGELLLRGFGKVCSVIVVIAALLLLTLYIAGLTPRGVYIWIAYHIKFAGEKRAERRAEIKEKRKNAQGGQRAIKEEEYLAYLRRKKSSAREVSDGDYFQNDAVNAKKASKSDKKQVQGTLYRVTKRRLTEMDIPVDDALPTSSDSSYGGCDEPAFSGEFDETNEATLGREASERMLKDEKADQGAVDERIFDEVMKRTRERIEKTRKTDGMREGGKFKTEAELGSERQSLKDSVSDFEETGAEFEDEISAGDVLDAVEMAALGIREKNRAHADMLDALPFDPDFIDGVPVGTDSDYDTDFAETDTVKLAMSSGSSGEIENDSDEFDVTKIFVNPADADMLDKLSEAYKNDTLNVKRENMSSKLQQTEKPQKPSAPVYNFPPIDILTRDTNTEKEDIKEELQDNAVKLVETLRSFNVRTKIENISRGPTITRYELIPDAGTRVRSITSLVDDIALNLATTGVRIEAPIPGKNAVGIEVPNKKQSTVHLRTLIESTDFVEAKSKLTVCLGEDVAGDAVYFDIAKMPHLLIAGTTGSGKSVCINSVIMSLLYKASPADVKLILIDPKKVELNIYNGIPHLLVPVISDTKKAAGALSWAVAEMERRYGLIEAVGVRDINTYNKVTKDDPDYEFMERIVIIIDELADFMMSAPDDVEESICRIAQKARAAGMHLIIGTQRPSVNVITGLIKANVPSRIAFTVTNQVDSRVILDRVGAENLIGRGDMLFNPVGALKPIRVQGAFVSEADVEEVVSYVKNMNSDYGAYSDEVSNLIEREAQKCETSGKKKGGGADYDDGDDDDPMLTAAIELAIESKKISTSLIQRRLSLGYGRAAKLIDRMQQLGYVSEPDGQKPREVLITKQEFMEMRLRDEID